MANQYPTSSVATDNAGKTTTTTYSYASPVVAKTADYTVQASDSGTDFTTAGATGSVTFTLPALQAGLAYRFIASAAQAMVVAATSALLRGSFTAGGAAAAAGVAISGTSLSCAAGTASNRFTAISVVCDGTFWYVTNIQGGGITVA